MLILQLVGNSVPLNEGNYSEPEWFTPLMQFHDRYGAVAWPLLALVVIGTIVWALMRASSHKSIPGPERLRLKKEIVQELRRKIGGLSLDQLVKYSGHESGPLHELLEEMVKDGMIGSGSNDDGIHVYRTRGM